MSHPDPSTSLLVLVVDDEPILRMLACKIIESLGHRCIEAESGERAVALCGDDVDVVLLDIVMPGIDGLETCRRLRAAPRSTGRARLPIWFLTGHVQPNTGADVAEAGGDGFMAKPVSRDVLAQLVEHVMSGDQR